MVFQKDALYPHMKVRECTGFSLKIADRSVAEIKSTRDKAVANLSLTPLLDRKPGALSGVQRQRVAMGRHPDVFLFDEPLSNFDVTRHTQMRVEIKNRSA